MLKQGRYIFNECSDDPGAVSGRDGFPLWQKALLFAVVYLACAELGHFFSGQNAPFVTFWLPSGLYVGVLLLNPTRQWPALALATVPPNLISDLSHGTPFPVILGFCAANTLHAVTGAWLVRRYVARKPGLGPLGGYFGLIGLAGIFSTMLGALAGAATLKISGLSPSFADSWKVWCGSNATAVLILTPFILTWFSNPGDLRGYLVGRKRQLEAALLLCGLVLSIWFALLERGGIFSQQRILLAPFLLWAGLRFGVRGATMVNLLLALLVGCLFNPHLFTGPPHSLMTGGHYIFTMQFVLAMSTFVAIIPALVLQERDRMLRQLSESEERFRNLTAAAFEGIAISEDGRLLDGNEQLFKMFGYTQPEMIGREILDLVAPESRAQVAEFIRLGKEEIYGHRLLRKDGTTFHGEARAKMVRVGDRTLRMTALRDITERQQALDRITEQAALLNETADAIIVCDFHDRVLYWNKGAERMYGWPAGEATGRQTAGLMYNNVDPAGRREAFDILMEKGEWSGELEHSTKDGRKLAVEARLSLVHDQRGRPKSVLCINTDITERKNIELQFMRAQRMESIGNLAGGIAHDLNNILAPIIMSIDILKDLVQDAKALDILETIHVSASRGAAIVQQVLSYARGSEGPQVEIHPADLIRDIRLIAKDTFPKNIRLETSVPKDAWNIMGDATQLYQILLNLCVNSRDAMPQGGLITITVKNRTVDGPRAAMHLESKAGPYVAFHVADTGIGIPKENLDRIFEPFFTTKEFGKGSGLGLSTLLSVVKSHGGFVNVESAPNEGTIFSLFFPAVATGPSPAALPVETGHPRGNGELVLVVDDEDSILAITRETLETFGYRVITASDGIGATEIYETRKNEIAVVITDMMMPFMDGPATILALKKVNPAVKIIAASGLNSNGKAAKAVEAGISYFLPKPYTAQTVLQALRKTLNTKNSAGPMPV